MQTMVRRWRSRTLTVPPRWRNRVGLSRDVLAAVKADAVGGREYRDEMRVQLAGRRGMESAQAGKLRLALVVQPAVGRYCVERDEYLLQMVPEVQVVV
jgi:hypothetical protein